MTGLVGGEYEAQDRIGLSGGGFGGLSAQGFTDRQGFGGGYGGGYGLQSTCPQDRIGLSGGGFGGLSAQGF